MGGGRPWQPLNTGEHSPLPNHLGLLLWAVVDHTNPEVPQAMDPCSSFTYRNTETETDGTAPGHTAISG